MFDVGDLYSTFLRVDASGESTWHPVLAQFVHVSGWSVSNDGLWLISFDFRPLFQQMSFSR